MRQKPIYKTPAGEQAVMAVYERILAQWPESTECLQIETRHGRTSVLALGQKDARPLVLLHGAGSKRAGLGRRHPEVRAALPRLRRQARAPEEGA